MIPELAELGSRRPGRAFGHCEQSAEEEADRRDGADEPVFFQGGAPNGNSPTGFCRRG